MFRVFHASESHPGLEHPVSELIHTTLSGLIYLTAGTSLLLEIMLGIFAPEKLAMEVWLIMPVLIISSGVALRLISKRLLLAQIIWQIGLLTMITLALHVLKWPEIAFLYTLVPFMFVLTHGYVGGALSELAILAIMLIDIYVQPFIFVRPGYLIPVVVSALFVALIGLVTSRTLTIVAEWSFQGFAQAQAHMEESRRSRGRLAQVLKDLDQAYYRLERTNATLIAAWRSAAEAEQTKSEFATSLSHELRTPLNLVIGFSEMMLTSPHKYGGADIPKPYRSDLYAIYQNAKHLDALVNDVLDLSRIGTGTLSLSREDVQVTDLIKEVAAMVRDYVAAKGLDLQLQIDPDVPVLYIDRLRIRQVLLNLLVNAARFTDAGWIRVAVSRNEQGVAIKVADTGHGIPENALPRIFEEFRQVEPSVSGGWIGGTGLGLPISKKLVELHGGELGVESVYQHGTTFWLTLPCVHALALDPQPLAIPLVHRAPSPVPVAKRILVVAHHDTQTSTYLQRLLQRYQIVPAANLAEGIALTQELNALGLLTEEQITPSQLAQGTLCIRLPLPSPTQSAQFLGAQSILVKPITPEQLWTAIEQVGRPITRVLVADDDPDMVRLLHKMLTPRIEPENCLAAYTGRQAMSLIRGAKPDLVLLDLVMPEMDGREVLALVNGDSEYAGIPIIVISARDHVDVEARLEGPVEILKAGGLRVNELTQVLDSCLDVLAPGWH